YDPAADAPMERIDRPGPGAYAAGTGDAQARLRGSAAGRGRGRRDVAARPRVLADRPTHRPDHGWAAGSGLSLLRANPAHRAAVAAVGGLGGIRAVVAPRRGCVAAALARGVTGPPLPAVRCHRRVGGRIVVQPGAAVRDPAYRSAPTRRGTGLDRH